MASSALTFLLYVLACLLCLRSWHVSRLGRALASTYTGPNRRRRRRDSAYRLSTRIWLVLGIAFFLLAANRVYDMYSPTADIIRRWAYGLGFEHNRRVFQGITLGIILVATTIALKAIPGSLEGMLKRHRLVVITSILLASYVVMRAVSFHYLDAALQSDVLGVHIRVLVEATLTTLIAYAAFRFSRWQMPRVSSRRVRSN